MPENIPEEGYKVEYGTEVVDTLTGFTGRITGYADYFGHRPATALVETIDTTGRPVEWWVELDRLRLKEVD